MPPSGRAAGVRPGRRRSSRRDRGGSRSDTRRAPFRYGDRSSRTEPRPAARAELVAGRVLGTAGRASAIVVRSRRDRGRTRPVSGSGAPVGGISGGGIPAPPGPLGAGPASVPPSPGPPPEPPAAAEGPLPLAPWPAPAGSPPPAATSPAPRSMPCVGSPPGAGTCRASRRAPRVLVRRSSDAPTAPPTPTAIGMPAALAAVSGKMQNCCRSTAAPRPAVAPPAKPWTAERVAPMPPPRTSDSARRIPPPTASAVAPAPAAVVNGLRPSTHT